MTNADKIRQMSDEELALLLATDSCPAKDSLTDATASTTTAKSVGLLG